MPGTKIFAASFKEPKSVISLACLSQEKMLVPQRILMEEHDKYKQERMVHEI